MLCRYCGKSLATVEGNVGTAHLCLGSSPRQPDLESPSPVSSLIQPRLPRLRLIPDSPERLALRGQGRKRDARPKTDTANPEFLGNPEDLPQLVIDGLLPPAVLLEHPNWQSRPVLVLCPREADGPAQAESQPAQAGARDMRLDALYRKLRADQGDARETLQAIGDLLLERKRYDEAEPIFRDLVALAPQSPQAQAGAGACLESQGRWGEAAARFRMALDSNPDLPAGLAGLGHCMLRLDNPELALHAFERCLVQDPGHIPAAVGKALSLQLVGKAGEAAAAYAVALRLRPGIQASLAGLMEGVALNLPAAPAPSQSERFNFQAIYNQGVTDFQNGKCAAAVSSFRSAARLRPNHAESWQAMGIALHERDEEGAKTAYRAALEISPDLSAARWNLGLLQEKTGELQEAGKTFSLLVQTESGRQEFWFRLASVLARTGDFEGAFAAARKCPDYVGSGSDLYLSLGALCWQRGEYTAAARCFEQLLKMSPGSVVAYRVLAAVAMRMEDYPRALEMHRHLYEGGDQSVEVLCNRAVLEIRAGRPIAALAYFRQAAELQPDCKAASQGIEMARRASLEAHKLEG